MSLQIWLPLNKTLENQGLSNNIFTNVNTTYTVNGPVGGSYTFNGTDSRLYTKYTGNTIFTISAWVNIKSFSNTTHYIICCNNADNMYETQLFNLSISKQSNNYCFAAVSNGISIIDTGHIIQLNTWYHVLCASNSKKFSLYINGNKIAEKDIPETILPGGNLCIGARSNNVAQTSFAYFLNADIADVRVYDHCCSVKEIREIYKTLVLHYPMNKTYVNRINSAITIYSLDGTTTKDTTITRNNDIGIDIKLNVLNSSANGTGTTINRNNIHLVRLRDLNFNGKTGLYTLSGYISATYSGLIRLDVCDHDVGTFNVTTEPQYFSRTINVTKHATVGDYNGFIDIETVQNGAFPIGTVFYFNHISLINNETGEEKILLNDNVPQYDVSGFNNHGTYDINSIKYNAYSPRNSFCYQFNGTNSEINTIKMQNEIINENAFTISAWIYPTASNNYRGVLGYHSGWGHGVEFAQFVDNKLEFAVGCSITDNANDWYLINTTNYELNKWSHYALVFNTRELLLYKNGTLVESKTINKKANMYTNKPVVIGKSYNDTDRFWAGKVSDLRIYGTALDIDDIKELYNKPINISKDKQIFTQGEFIETNPINELDFEPEYKEMPDGAVFIKVFEHNNHSGTVVFNSIEECIYSNTIDKFSRLSSLDYFKDINDDKYEFIICYPDYSDKYNRWKQSIHPVYNYVEPSDGTTNVFVPGYEPIHIDWDGILSNGRAMWGGLSLSSPRGTNFNDMTSLIDGTQMNNWWWFAIGAQRDYYGGTPGPRIDDDNNKIITDRVQLWIKTDKKR